MDYYDTEHGAIVTEAELFREWSKVSADGEHDGWTFADYVRACCDQDGTLIPLRF